MTKTYKNLFEHLTTFEALHRAYGRVVKGRRHQMDVIRFETNLESNLIEIQNSLLWKTCQTGPYRNFKVFEPKERDIAALPIKDRIVQHALVETIDPIWASRFILRRIWPTHRKIRKDSAGRMRRKMKRMARLYHEGKMTWDQVHQVIMSRIGHAGHANTYKLRTRVLCDVPFIPPLLEVQRMTK